MPRILRNLRLDEVSLVDEGANQYAHILLSKQAGDPTPANEVDVNLTEIAKALGLADTATAEEVVAAVETFKTANKVALDEAAAKAEAANMEKAAAEARLAEIEKSLKPAEPDISTLPEEVQKQINELVEIKKTLAAAETERERLVEINKAKDAYKHLIDQDTIGGALFTLRKADKDAADKLETVLKAADARASLAPVTEVVGKSTADESATGEDRLEVLAKQAQVESGGKLSYHQAYAKVLKANPNLLTGKPVAEDK